MLEGITSLAIIIVDVRLRQGIAVRVMVDNSGLYTIMKSGCSRCLLSWTMGNDVRRGLDTRIKVAKTKEDNFLDKDGQPDPGIR